MFAISQFVFYSSEDNVLARIKRYSAFLEHLAWRMDINVDKYKTWSLKRKNPGIGKRSRILFPFRRSEQNRIPRNTFFDRHSRIATDARKNVYPHAPSRGAKFRIV